MRNLILNPQGNTEINLWLGLSLLEEDPYKSLVGKLKEIGKNSPDYIEIYLEHANNLIETVIDRPLLINFLVDALIQSKPTLDKIEDCLKLKNEVSNLELEKVLALEDFLDRCRKAI